MGSIQVKGKSILIDGRETFLRSGEIHYFRIYKRNWRERLRQAKANCLNAIASYIPWDFHEPEEGDFDFDGRTLPERDLRGFLEMLKEEGLYFIAKPGPFINAEYIDGGHPRWMFERYPETISRRPGGEQAYWIGQGNHVPAQLDDTFLQLAERWYAQVIPLLAEYSIEQGGPIILHQPDNEMNLLFTCLDPNGSLFDPEVVGEEGRPGRFHRDLLEQYGSLEALNRRYGTGFAGIEEIRPQRPTGHPEGDARLYLDWMRFRMRYVYRYAHTLAQWTRQYGLEVPITYNEPINGFFRGPGNHAEFVRYMKDGGQDVFTTCHSYLRYAYHMDANGVPKTALRLESLKTQAADNPTIAIEVGAGWMTLDSVANYSNYPVHLRVLLGHGMDGYNYFIFASGDKGFSRTYVTDAYDLFADPVSAAGKEHEVYAMTGAFNRFVAQWEQELADTRKQYDVVIGLTGELYLMSQYAVEETAVFEDNMSGAGSLSASKAKSAVDSVEQLAKLLAMNNIQFAVMNLDYPNREPGFDELLIVPNDGSLSREAFRYLNEHGDRGGRVVLYPEVPCKDTDGNPAPGLAETLNYRKRREIPRFGMRAGDIGRRFMSMKELDGIPADQLTTMELPAGAEQIVSFEGETSAYRAPFRSGEALVMGFAPQFTGLDNVTALKLAVVPFLKRSRRCHTAQDRYHAVCRSGSRMSLVTVVNMTGCAGGDRVIVQTEGGALEFPRLSVLDVASLAALMLPVDAKLSYGTLKYCTSELVPLDDARRTWQATGAPGTEGEIAFDRPVQVVADGRQLEIREVDGLFIAVYGHGLKPIELFIEPPAESFS